MLKNEKPYTEDDIIRMLSEEEIFGDEMQGEYFAICDNGKAYHATYVNKYFEKGVFFFTIPAGIKILGYVPDNKTTLCEKVKDLCTQYGEDEFLFIIDNKSIWSVSNNEHIRDVANYHKSTE